MNAGKYTHTSTYGSTLGAFYRLSLYLGIRTLLSGKHLKMALARLINPLSYPRHLEFALTLRDLHVAKGLRVLDIGSPKLLALFLASRLDLDLWITDIRDYFVPSTRDFLRVLGQGSRVGESVHLETQDARALRYGANSFDRIFAVSVIEHIPNGGDSTAIQEIARVLKPGGTAVLTVPFAEKYVEEHVASDVYERKRKASELVFYQRRYDYESLHLRLIAPSSLQLQNLTLFGEPTFRFEPTWNRIPLVLKLPWLWTQPFVARAFLRELSKEGAAAANGCVITLAKPSEKS
jgi:SAM-dependent methyltransferase